MSGSNRRRVNILNDGRLKIALRSETLNLSLKNNSCIALDGYFKFKRGSNR